MAEEKNRNMGLETISDVSWGTHFCMFYKTKEDLLDILVPYFKTGLGNNEYCVWLTSDPLKTEDARIVLAGEIENFENYVEKGQMTILNHSDWHTETGDLNSKEVLEKLIEKEREVIEKGFDGLRVAGETLGLEKRDWRNFVDYEATVNSIIKNHKVIAIGSYSLDKCNATEMVDIIGVHRHAFIKNKGKWQVIRSFEDVKKTEEKWYKETEALDKINKCFLNFGASVHKNIREITKTTGEVLGGACVLYNKEKGNFYIQEGWNIPETLIRKDAKAGHLCCDAINGKDEPLVVNNLDETIYAQTDPNVAKFNLKTFVGCSVKVAGCAIGSLCVAYTENRIFDPNELRILSVLASALGIEEERRMAEEEIKRGKEEAEKFLSQLKIAHKKLKSMQDELLEKKKITAIGVLAAGVAHELRNPLAVIGMTVQFMETKFDKNDPRRELTDAIIRKVERLDKVIRELANFGEILELNFHKCNLIKCLDLNVALIKPHCRVRKIKIRKKYSDIPPIEMDDEQMDKVFFNIMNNALQAMRKGGVLTIEVKLDENIRMVVIKIHNTGSAIQGTHLPHIFEPFFSFNKAEGTGLGLAIAQGVILTHNGLITVESKKSGENKGVAFIIQLPLKQNKGANCATQNRCR